MIETAGQPDGVVGALESMAKAMWGGTTPVWDSVVGEQLQHALGAGNMSTSFIQINHYESRGINMHWFGNIKLYIESPKKVDQGTGQVTAGGGGGSSYKVGSSEGSKDSAGAKGSGKSGDTGGEVSVGTESSKGSTAEKGGSSNATVSAGTKDNLERYQATIVANISLNAELDISGTDYINPFKWGMAAGEALKPIPPQKRDVNCGTVTYQKSAGMAK